MLGRSICQTRNAQHFLSTKSASVRHSLQTNLLQTAIGVAYLGKPRVAGLDLQDHGQDVGQNLHIWLQSRDLAGLQKEADMHNGKVSVVLDGHKRALQSGRHFHLPDRNFAQST